MKGFRVSWLENLELFKQAYQNYEKRKSKDHLDPGFVFPNL